MVFLTTNDQGELVEVDDEDVHVTQEEWDLAHRPITFVDRLLKLVGVHRDDED